MAVSCPYVTMFVDLENFRPLWAREHGARESSIGATHSAFSKVAGKSFSVYNRFGPNLVHLLGVPEEDRPPTLKKIRQL